MCDYVQGSTLSIARLPGAGKTEVGQVIPDTYLLEGHVKRLENSRIYPH